jgi:hypothetical protein
MAALTTILLAFTSREVASAVELDLRRAADWAARGPVIMVQVRMIGAEGPKPEVARFKQFDIVSIVSLHGGPSLGISVHAAKPSMLPLVWKFSSQAKNLTKRIQAVAVERETLSRELKGANGFVITGGWEAMGDESRVRLANVESYIMADDNVGFVQKSPEFPDKRIIVFGPSSILWKIREGSDCYALIGEELVSEG